MMVAAEALAGSAIDLYRFPDLLQRARDDHKKIMAGQNYVTLIPKGQRAPVQIR